MMQMQQDKLPTVANEPHREDMELVRLVVGGDKAAERRLLKKVIVQVRRTVSYTVKDQDMTDDVTQQALLKILDSLRDYRGDASVNFWASRISVRMATKLLKKNKRREMLMAFFPEPTPSFLSPHEELSKNQIRERINQHMGKLPVKQQVVIRLSLVEGYSLEEMAQLTDTPVNTVRGRLGIGRKRLKQYIEKDTALEFWFSGKENE